MTSKSIYFERILFREMLIGLGLMAGFLAVSAVWGVGATFPTTALFWFLILMLLVLFNFMYLKIQMSTESITVGFGRITRQIPWDNIASCYLDTTSAVFYGGFGIRVTRIRRKWRLAYNIMSTPRVVVSLNSGNFQEFVFSTNNPEEVMRLINEHIDISNS